MCFKFLLYALTRQSTGSEKREQVTLSLFVCLFLETLLCFPPLPNSSFMLVFLFSIIVFSFELLFFLIVFFLPLTVFLHVFMPC